MIQLQFIEFYRVWYIIIYEKLIKVVNMGCD